jgi:hypothetical protein
VVAYEVTWQNMRADQAITNIIFRNINAELLLMSRLQETMRIVLWPLALAAKMYDATSEKSTEDTKGGSAQC